jgi:hypothetical protein
LKRACSMFMARTRSHGARMKGELYQTGTVH